MGDVLNVKALNCKDLGFYSFLFSYIYLLYNICTAAAKTREFSEMQIVCCISDKSQVIATVLILQQASIINSKFN
jgi:hypothetical protein